MREKILQAIDKNSKLTPQDLAAMLGSTTSEVEEIL